MKRILIAALAVCLALFACGKAAFNAAADLPDGILTLSVEEVGRRGRTYYVMASPADGSGARYTFKLAESFSARAFEPGADGAVYMLDYHSPADFHSQWYRLAKELGALGASFDFIFAGDELIFLADIAGFSPPDGWPMEDG